jgi:inward rectifier potassium channel
MAGTESETGVVVIGARSRPLQDLFHLLLRASWPRALAIIVSVWLCVNALFALIYMQVGGIANSSGDFLDSMFFSIETMGTIGYGEMAPATRAAHAAVMLQSVTGLLLTALATGLVFTKFALPSARLVFSNKMAIAPMDGVPTLMVRVGNDRSSTIAEARVRVGMVHTDVTREGVTMYRLEELQLARDSTQALTRSWTVMHKIDEKSPLYGLTPDDLVEREIEFFVTVVGTDDTSRQPVHGRHRYLDTDLSWGARHADVLREREDGLLELDVRKFHDMVVTTPTEAFPYPRA